MSGTQRILITGSQGFIGKALTLSLRDAGYDVWEIARSGLQEDSQVVHADLLDLEQTCKAIESVPPFTTLIHTAALAHAQRPPSGESFLSINTKITNNVIQALGRRNPRLIFLSSVAVYGEDNRHDSVSVTDDLRPATDYGKSKALCEKLILESNLNNCDILRLAPVYDEAHMSDVRKRVFLPGPFTIKIWLTPPPRYSLCHINTVVQSILDILARQSDGRRIHNVADPVPYDQHELASWFPGKAIPVPICLIRLFYWLAGLLPRKCRYALRCFYWKLFQSNIYVTDVQ